jgi:hypothetical protein
MSKPVKAAEVYRRGMPENGGTFLDQIAAVTKIGGSASLDQQFGNGRNPFKRSISEVFEQDKSRNGGK